MKIAMLSPHHTATIHDEEIKPIWDDQFKGLLLPHPDDVTLKDDDQLSRGSKLSRTPRLRTPASRTPLSEPDGPGLDRKSSFAELLAASGQLPSSAVGRSRHSPPAPMTPDSPSSLPLWNFSDTVVNRPVSRVQGNTDRTLPGDIFDVSSVKLTAAVKDSLDELAGVDLQTAPRRHSPSSSQHSVHTKDVAALSDPEYAGQNGSPTSMQASFVSTFSTSSPGNSSTHLEKQLSPARMRQRTQQTAVPTPITQSEPHALGSLLPEIGPAQVPITSRRRPPVVQLHQQEDVLQPTPLHQEPLVLQHIVDHSRSSPDEIASRRQQQQQQQQVPVLLSGLALPALELGKHNGVSGTSSPRGGEGAKTPRRARKTYQAPESTLFPPVEVICGVPPGHHDEAHHEKEGRVKRGNKEGRRRMFANSPLKPVAERVRMLLHRKPGPPLPKPEKPEKKETRADRRARQRAAAVASALNSDDEQKLLEGPRQRVLHY